LKERSEKLLERMKKSYQEAIHAYILFVNSFREWKKLKVRYRPRRNCM